MSKLISMIFRLDFRMIEIVTVGKPPLHPDTSF